ncbi:hypothetical protein BBN03_08040, partial [Vibrio parahaemolyticus]|uniref:hypothetical protein n=1 Tax=Vibrio parahaemolyticus TaxID=670 RepID=UPI00084B4003
DVAVSDVSENQVVLSKLLLLTALNLISLGNFLDFFEKSSFGKGIVMKQIKKQKNFNFSLKLLFELSIQPDFSLKLRIQIT